MTFEEFSARLPEHLRERGIPFSEAQAGLCVQHVRLMLEWNRRINLTRITDLRDILVKHILDSLVPSRLLPDSGPALDVGTGPGFPGIPLKILNPNLSMILLDSNRKKVSFLKTTLSHLGLDRIEAAQAGWEDLFGPGGWRRGLDAALPASLRRDAKDLPGFRLITMRAVRPDPRMLSALASRALAPGGVFAFWAGPGVLSLPDEPGAVGDRIGLSFEGASEYSLPTIATPRRLYLWRRT